MIPHRLQLRNFLSYGEGVPPLDLTGIRLACLSGDNGNGKSALLDAMTWALFGKTRAASDDAIIRHGATECQVIFDFSVAEIRYRIRRQRTKRGGFWELSVIQDDGTPRPLTGGIQAETKAKIAQILRMDYETFLATAYLAQGQANVFASAKPAERKKILAEILDLSRYDRLETLARDAMNAAARECKDAETQLVHIDDDLQHVDGWTAQRDDAVSQIAALAREQDGARTTLETLRTQLAQAEGFEEKIADFRARAAELAARIAREERQRADDLRQLQNAETIEATRARVDADAAEDERLARERSALERLYDQLVPLQQEEIRLRSAIQDAQTKLERERYRLEQDATILQNEAADAARFASERDEVDRQLAELAGIDEALADAEARRRDADDRTAELRGKHAGLKARETALDKRRDALESTDGGACDFCGQPLPPAARARARAETQDELAEILAQLDEIKQGGRDAKRVKEIADADRAHWLEQLRRRDSLTTHRGYAEQEHLRLGARQESLAPLQRKLAELEMQLTRREFAHGERERLEATVARSAGLATVGEKIRAIDAARAAFTQLERRKLALEQARQTLETLPPRIAETDETLKKERARLAAGEARLAEYETRIANLAELRAAFRDADTRFRTLETQIQTARDLQVAADANLKRLETLAAERTKYESERLRALRDVEIHKELALAFGKKGIPVSLMESAIPDLENETNNLLGRMTGGAFSVAFRTTREAKTKGGGPIETLDIDIADDMGTRAFEMYSGGEAFRVSLALRVALSKMMARRAGAPLQTLILDEGFGTQDPRGREAIAEALEAISDDFALILVITHVEELKDRFPTRIEVMKNAAGSTFTIAE